MLVSSVEFELVTFVAIQDSATSLNCRRQTRATRCLTPIVLYTQMDA